MQHHKPHTTYYTKAICFIQSHGHFATLTHEGILAQSLCGWTRDAAHSHGIPEDDRWFEEPTVFHVDDAGMVSSKAIRDWLGY